MDKKDICIVVLSLTILVLSGLLLGLILGKKHKEGFRKCICSSRQGGRERECQDDVDVNNLYVEGKLTEFSEFKSPGWDRVSPGDTMFPLSQGCTWPNCSNGKNQFWDYTEFGS